MIIVGWLSWRRRRCSPTFFSRRKQPEKRPATGANGSTLTSITGKRPAQRAKRGAANSTTKHPTGNKAFILLLLLLGLLVGIALLRLGPAGVKIALLNCPAMTFPAIPVLLRLSLAGIGIRVNRHG